MVDPGTATIIAASLAAAAQGASGAMGSASNAKAEKRKAKEMKRQTLADMYNKALGRELDLYKFTKENESTNTARRSAALQESANAFIRSLTGR